jgi:hypothetical protein
MTVNVVKSHNRLAAIRVLHKIGKRLTTFLVR